MSKGMLGMLPLSAVQGPKATLDVMLAGADGPEVLEQLKRFTRREPCWGQSTARQQLKEWQLFYREIFRRTLDDAVLRATRHSTLRIPVPKEGFTRLIVVLPGLKIEEVFAQCKKRFPVWRWTNENLDQITKSQRRATTKPYDIPYAVWVRDAQESDPDRANTSYDALVQKGVVGITLLERLLYELKYFAETEKHLDTQSMTLCTGTMYSTGTVARMFWFGDCLYVHQFPSDGVHPNTRVREVVDR